MRPLRSKPIRQEDGFGRGMLMKMEEPWKTEDWGHYANEKTGSGLVINQDAIGYGEDIILYNVHVIVEREKGVFEKVFHGDINQLRYGMIFGWSVINKVPVYICYERGNLFAATYGMDSLREKTLDSFLCDELPFGEYCLDLHE